MMEIQHLAIGLPIEADESLTSGPLFLKIVRSKSLKMESPKEVPTSTLPGDSKRAGTLNCRLENMHKQQSGPVLQTEGAGNPRLPIYDNENEK